MRSPRRCAVRRLVREFEAAAFAGSFRHPAPAEPPHIATPTLSTRGFDMSGSFSRRARST
ncbi:hypothetical protein VTO73DRAFT_10955 [Trametes versicolor]